MMRNKNTSIILIYLKGEKREGSKPKYRSELPMKLKICLDATYFTENLFC